MIIVNIEQKRKMYSDRKKNTFIVKNSFDLIHWNCNSLKNKIEEFKLFCLKFNPQIISLNETKMSEFNASYILNIDNYITIHKARSNDKNGQYLLHQNFWCMCKV
jgi:hypothetical protein